jgi:lysophospholipase L1-like esterase
MPNVTALPRTLENGRTLTQFTDTTSTTAVTYTYPTQQTGIQIENSGEKDIFVTVGSYTNQLVKADTKWKVDVSFTSFSISSVVNSQEFIATAFVDVVTDINTLATQLTEKAKQTDLNTTNAQLSTKRDKATAIALADLATDARTAMTGGSVAVVGTDMVGTENIKPGAFSYFKHFAKMPMTLKSQPKNLFNKNTVTSGYAVVRLDGTLTANASYSTSDYIFVKPSTTYTKNNSDPWACYDVNKVYVGGSNSGGTDKNTFTTPANAQYIRISAPTTSIATLQLEEGITSTTYEAHYSDLLFDVSKYFTGSSFLSMMQNNIGSVDTTSMNLFKPALTSKNLFNKNTVTNGYFVARLTGDLSANASYSASAFISVKPSTNYVKNNTDQFAYYDANKNYISGEANGVSAFTTPSNCGYVRIACPTSSVGTLQLEEGTTSTSYVDYGQFITRNQVASDVRPPISVKSVMSQLVLSSTTKKIKILGDSITHGVGGTGWAQDGALIMTLGSTSWNVNTSGHCWANSLKAYFESKFNCQVSNYGCSGANSNDIVNGLSQLVSATDNIVICMIGTNDRHITTKQQFYDNLRAIYNYCNNLGIQVVFMASIPAGLASETDAVNVYHMEDVDSVVMKAATDLGLDYISMYKLFTEYCQTREITIDSLLSDGLHPNDTGYDAMFYLVSNALGIGPKRTGATW